MTLELTTTGVVLIFIALLLVWGLATAYDQQAEEAKKQARVIQELQAHIGRTEAIRHSGQEARHLIREASRDFLREELDRARR